MMCIVRWFTVFYLTALTILLELPNLQELPQTKTWFTLIEGFEHILPFAFLGLLVQMCCLRQSMFCRVSLLFLYSLGTEIFQGLLHPICGRVFDWTDVSHDMLGILAGTLLGYFFRAVVSRRAG